MRLRVVLLILIAAASVGCRRESTVVGVSAVPRTCAGPSQFACRGWMPCEPATETAVFDLGVSSAAAVDRIRQFGGTVLHEYHVGLVRARVPVAAVPTLVDRREIVHAQEVHPGDALEFRGLIGIPTPLSAPDRAFLESVGVTVLREFVNLPAVVALIPDESVPAIRGRSGVQFVDADGYVCADDSSGTAAAWRTDASLFSDPVADGRRVAADRGPRPGVSPGRR